MARSWNLSENQGHLHKWPLNNSDGDCDCDCNWDGDSDCNRLRASHRLWPGPGWAGLATISIAHLAWPLPCIELLWPTPLFALHCAALLLSLSLSASCAAAAVAALRSRLGLNKQPGQRLELKVHAQWHQTAWQVWAKKRQKQRSDSGKELKHMRQLVKGQAKTRAWAEINEST